MGGDRRRRAGRLGVALLLGALLTLAGCAGQRLPGIDGSLTDDWPALPTPSPFLPQAGVCHAGEFADSAGQAAYHPVDCAKPHRTETVYVGQFPATDNAAAPPTRTSAAHIAAYQTCNAKAAEYVGRDFRWGRLWLGVTVPSSPAWAGGARWFRCELAEVSSVEDFGPVVERTGSLKGALTPSSPLWLGCYQVTAVGGEITRMAKVACTTKHNSEFVGPYTAPATLAYPQTPAAWTDLHQRCRRVVARYVSVPNDANLKYRTGTVAVPGAQEDWDGGNKGVRCYLYKTPAAFTSSLATAGDKGLPD